MERNAVYAGYFNIFTNADLEVLKQSSMLFDNVTILLIHDEKVNRLYNILYVKEAIDNLILKRNLSNCKVDISRGLVADYCKENNINFCIRKYSDDEKYEKRLINFNKSINKKLTTVFLNVNEEITVSDILSLSETGHPVSEFVPEEILPILRTY